MGDDEQLVMRYWGSSSVSMLVFYSCASHVGKKTKESQHNDTMMHSVPDSLLAASQVTKATPFTAEQQVIQK